MQVPQTVTNALKGKNIIVFDGVCVLCNGWVKFTLRYDRQERFHFVIAQSDFGEKIYADLGLKSTDYETFIVFTDGQLHTKLDGVFALFSTLGYPWKIFSVFRVLPRPMKNLMYDLVAKNRYRLFGKRDTCMIPTPDVRARFLD